MTSRAEAGMAAGFRLQLVMYEDFVMPAGILPNLVSMATRNVRDDDIYICTYPKSGTHWVWEIVNMVTSGTAQYAEQWQNSSFLEARTGPELDELPSPRIFITHLTPRLMPLDVWRKRCHVINVQRNPKDAIVSFFEQHTNQNWVDKSRDPAFTGSWESYIDVHINGLAPFDSVFDHMKTWDKFPAQYPDVPFMQLTYEALKQDDVREVRRLADFLQRPLSDSTCRKIAEACRFEPLKHASEHLKDQTFHNRWRDGSSGYFRKGILGDWKNRFTVAQSERFDQQYKQIFHNKCPYQ